MILSILHINKKCTHSKARFSSFVVDKFCGKLGRSGDQILDQLVNTINKPYMENCLPKHAQGRGKRGGLYNQAITLRKSDTIFYDACTYTEGKVSASYASLMQQRAHGLRFSEYSIKAGVKNNFSLPLKKLSLNPKKGIGILNIVISKNNTQLTLSSQRGKVIQHGWASAGSCGFKNSRKSTIFAAQAATKSLCSKAKSANIRRVIVKLRGAGRARGALMQTLEKSSMKCIALKECTPIVYNGCRRVRTQRK